MARPTACSSSTSLGFATATPRYRAIPERASTHTVRPCAARERTASTTAGVKRPSP